MTDSTVTDSTVINDGHVHLGMTARDPAQRPDEVALVAEMDRHGVARAAVITPAVCGWDNQVTLAAVQAHPDRFVGVARIDVSQPTAPQECADLLDRGLCGIRIDVRGSDDVLRATTTREVVAVLRERRAVLDLHASAAEFATVAELAERCPDLTVLLDHGGRPTPADLRQPSGKTLGPLLDRANLVIKTPNASAFSAVPPPHEDLTPFLHWLVDAIGADRVMWGSDWPVCPDDSAYGGAFAAAAATLGGLPIADRTAVLRGTFDRVFDGVLATDGSRSIA